MPTTPYDKYCWVCWKGGKCIRWASAHAVKRAANWAPIMAGLLAWYLSPSGNDLIEPDTPLELVGQIILYVCLAYCLLFIALCAISPWMIERDGEWRGARYVYSEPKLAFHKFVGPSESGKDFTFRFPDAAPFSVVSYYIKPDTAWNFVDVHVAATPAGMASMALMHQHQRGAIRVNHRRDLCCRLIIKENASPFSVRIYVTGWDEGDGKEFQDKPHDRNSGLAVLAWLRS